MKKEKILCFISLLMLLFLALPATSAHINITDVGTGYDGDPHYGYVNYRNTADFNLSGAILVFIDGDIVAGKLLDMPIRYVAGFRCSPIKTIEFSINESKGNHTIAVYIYSMNDSVESTYEYNAEGIEDVIDVEEREIEEDWLTCWKCRG